MAELFGRHAILQVNDVLIDARVEQGIAKGLDFAFSVERTLKKFPNTANIQVFNLNADRRSQLQSLESVPVKLSAGYLSAQPTLIFAGDLRQCNTKRSGASLITTIEAGDGEKKFQKSRVKTSFKPTVKVQDVIRHIAKAMGVGIGNLEEATQGLGLEQLGQTFPKGVVLTGRASAALDNICSSTGLEYSIQDGNLQFLKRNTALSAEAILLTYETGLLSAPERGSDGIVHANSLIVPNLFPGRKVRFDDDKVRGFFRVVKAKYTGSTVGKDWGITMECKEL